ncbi:hypothetical protein DEO72_LG6g1253 [Vigna unguiculata]|uniref:Secreted protein n=1 Tax=Vigna unguiculata TaxID=3917 RepID=A0A4D6M6P2_VIGUN|nr:hypothetical protein DEO72_LG6g1253 [Vigna unguiculata]
MQEVFAAASQWLWFPLLLWLVLAHGAAREIWIRGWLQVRHKEASLARVCRSFRFAMKNGGVVAVCAAADLWRRCDDGGRAAHGGDGGSRKVQGYYWMKLWIATWPDLKKALSLPRATTAFTSTRVWRSRSLASSAAFVLFRFAKPFLGLLSFAAQVSEALARISQVREVRALVFQTVARPVNLAQASPSRLGEMKQGSSPKFLHERSPRSVSACNSLGSLGETSGATLQWSGRNSMASVSRCPWWCPICITRIEQLRVEQRYPPQVQASAESDQVIRIWMSRVES